MTIEKKVDNTLTSVQKKITEAFQTSIPKDIQSQLDEMKRLGDEIKEMERLSVIFHARPEVFKFYLNIKKLENIN